LHFAFLLNSWLKIFIKLKKAVFRAHIYGFTESEKHQAGI